MSPSRMSIVESEFAPSCDPRLAAQLADHATGALPAWLWRADGSRILWANAVGAAIFGAADTSQCAARRFDLKHPAAVEIARLAATLSSAGQARLERLRGFGASFGRALTCVCSRFNSADGVRCDPRHRDRAGRTKSDARRAHQSPVLRWRANARRLRTRRHAALRYRSGADADCRHCHVVQPRHCGDRASGARGRQRRRHDRAWSGDDRASRQRGLDGAGSYVRGTARCGSNCGERPGKDRGRRRRDATARSRRRAAAFAVSPARNDDRRIASGARRPRRCA